MLVKAQVVNYKADCTFAPPVEPSLINTDDIQSVVPEDSYGYRVRGPLVRVKFRNGESLLCQNEVHDFYPEN